MKSYLECWTIAAAALFPQALSGEPGFAEAPPEPPREDSFGFAAFLAGDVEGWFTVSLDGAILSAPLLGEGVDQKAGWGELLRETSEAAAGDLLATAGKKCRLEKFEEVSGRIEVSRAFQLSSGDRSWTILVHDETRATESGASLASELERTPRALSPGLELLLDVELEASLRFGSREMPLGEILDLGPGDVVQLDRHVSDPVDLIIGDKIVARGEVVLVNGNFGLRVSEVAEPKKRLESIRCLF
ncbi:MAG: FliM/FliN family flagellar motor C-terminal domain-containing protein [Acidobacteriota bacterium]